VKAHSNKRVEITVSLKKPCDQLVMRRSSQSVCWSFYL